LIIMLGIAAVGLLPLQVGLSQLHLARAISAFKAGDCHRAVQNALKAESSISARAEPFEILGYCDARYGHSELALTSIRDAINRDPQNWEYHYDMALVMGAGGLDPRREARIARALNPLSPLTTALADAVHPPDPGLWRAQALAAPLLIPGQSVLRLALPRG
jgi:Flp pilus assembly protein TadD